MIYLYAGGKDFCMKRILLLSTMYPSDDASMLNDTRVCHYFALQWMKMGYTVRVIYLYHVFPYYFYPALYTFRKYIANKTGVGIPLNASRREHTYTIDDIVVTKIPVLETRPHGIFKQREIDKTVEKIVDILRSEGFEPDFLLGHFIHPTLEVIAELKNVYSTAVSTISLHGEENNWIERNERALKNIDFVGYRSYPIKKAFEKTYGARKSFMCLSGVPSSYLSAPKSFVNGISSFVFIGGLIERKYPDILMSSICKSGWTNFRLTYVGEGGLEKRIKMLSQRWGVAEKVRFTHRIPRDKVLEELDDADVFIMVSERETFGLVYLEAMARGCIVVASRGEGMDGVIEDGVNGFLSKAGDEEELTRVLKKIASYSAERLAEISLNAFRTACEMTDEKMARRYISQIQQL